MTSEFSFSFRGFLRPAGAGALLFAFLAAGCGPSVGELSGTVLQKNGSPLPGGIITFYPEKGNPVSATIQENGTYEVNNVPAGPVRIAVDNSALKPGGGGPVGGAFALKAIQPPKDALGKMKESGKAVPTFEKAKLAGKYVRIAPELSRAETSGMTAKVEGGKQQLDVNLPK
jgi:hypothetical protein